MSSGWKNQGRRKANKGKMENKSDPQEAILSNQCRRLFKKADELCTLTGTKVGLIVIPRGKGALSFGRPGINTMVEQFSAQNSSTINLSNRSICVQQSEAWAEKEEMEILARLEKELEAEKARHEEVVCEKKKWVPNLGDLSYEQLEVLKGKIMELAKDYETLKKSTGSSSLVVDPDQRFD